MTPRLLEPTEPISSLSNPRVKALRKLARRSERERAGAFLAEGPSVVDEALEAGWAEEVFVTSGSDLLPDPGNVPRWVVTEDVMRSIATTTTPQGVVARVKTPDTSLDRLSGSADLVVVLADVRDPGNAGTLIRSAVAAGAGAVVFASGSVDAFSPKTVRSSAGGIFRVPVLIAPLSGAIAALRSRDFLIAGTEASASATVDDITAGAKVAVVLGNEAWGLSDEVRELMDIVIGIPMRGPAESLNVAVAGSILLFELSKSRP